MKYVFLTACRNEEAIVPAFVDEFTAMALRVRARRACTGPLRRSTIFLDWTERGSSSPSARARTTPSSCASSRRRRTLGNQGAMFYGLGRVEVGPEDVLVTFDCDGEDDVREIPSILELGAANPGKVVLIERGRRAESLVFRVFFTAYKALFRALTRQRVVPNNFLLIPGAWVPVMAGSPLAAVHLAYAILKLNPPSVTTTRNRRPRYGGRTSQNLFTLVSHGLVGLMVFYEVVVVKLFLLLFVCGAVAAGILGLALVVPSGDATAQRVLVLSALAAGIAAIGFFALLFSAALAMMFKLTAFTLIHVYGDQREARIRRKESMPPERRVAPAEIDDRKAR